MRSAWQLSLADLLRWQAGHFKRRKSGDRFMSAQASLAVFSGRCGLVKMMKAGAPGASRHRMISISPG
jgi:hypothetical protein